ncbi:MAG: hypothetical protein EZS28_029087 [Streblomastix strix]|uniref:Uncharacterized protein n=1 Tax=Streblomastix strix TaxID=222440 RepID=A0A5J4UXD1_9EUKA|nr:MAG: hypothetical protein EZS28_029087 [Streblomastix strix]
MPIYPPKLYHLTVEYLMAYGQMDQFKAQRGFITYEFETLSDQVMKNITDYTTSLSQLSRLSIVSTESHDENIPFDRCVKVFGQNSSRLDIALLRDALHCELWTTGIPIGDLRNTKSITVTHKKLHMKLQFIDAENLFGPMTLKI